MNLLKATIALALNVITLNAYCQIKLPRLISDGMILQRDADTRIWGWAAPNETVTMKFEGVTYSAIAESNGTWTFKLKQHKAGGPYKMTFKASNEVTVNNILFGDVYVCAGQSNMELPMLRVQDKYPMEIVHSKNDFIRQFEVPDHYNFNQPDTDLTSGQWIAAAPDKVLQYSAVGYFFANEIYLKYKVPVGLINTALGGSPAQAWLSAEALREFPDYYTEALKYQDRNYIDQIETADAQRSKDWYKKLDESDEGLKANWRDPTLDDANWEAMNVPGYWKDGPLGNINGVVWFRKTFHVGSPMTTIPSKLLLGRIVDADSVFINGKFIGNTTYLYPPRRYQIPAGTLKEGDNKIVIRVINNTGSGGFVLDKPYLITAGTETIDLKGSWKYKLGAVMDPLPGQTFVRWKPMGLYNGMIAPITNYDIKGILWYQGESNVSKPQEYTALMKALIYDWRLKWQQGNIPFIMVQLANFMEPQLQPSESNWAALRQAQLSTLSVANTGMAVAIDIGEWNDIHPLNKKEVGRRLALQAMHLAYHDKAIIASGPLFKSITKDSNKLVIQFSSVGKGLKTKNNKPLQYVAIAGPDKIYKWANGKITGDKIIVWNKEIPNPVYVRYGWADNPEGANLYNDTGLPASPFEASINP